MGGRDQPDPGEQAATLSPKSNFNSQLNDSLDSDSLNLILLTFQAGNLTLRTLGLAGATVLSAELLGKVELEVENTLLQC